MSKKNLAADNAAGAFPCNAKKCKKMDLIEASFTVNYPAIFPLHATSKQPFFHVFRLLLRRCHASSVDFISVVSMSLKGTMTAPKSQVNTPKKWH